MELGHAKRLFIATKKSENVTGRTLETYTRCIHMFFDYLIEKENIYDVSEIKTINIRNFLNHLHEKGLRGITRHQHFRILRTFFYFLHRDDYINKNPMLPVRPPKVEQKKMRTFTAQEISKLLNAFDKSTFIGFRNYCIFCMFFSTGIRKTELINLKESDVNLTTDFIRIRTGKGEKERIIPIGRTLKRVINQYLTFRTDYLQHESAEWFFVTPRFERKLTSSTINILFQKLKKELGLVGEKVSSHTWRHTFAKNYLLNGGDVFSLMEIMGHADLATTRQYIGLNDNEIKIQHAKFNPLDNKDWFY